MSSIWQRIRSATDDTTVLRVLCLFTLALLLATRRLWINDHLFPQVPLLLLAVEWPSMIDRVCGWTLLGALLAGGAFAHISRVRMAVLVCGMVSLGLLFVGDQHRLQPWAYHFFLSAWLLAFCRAPRSQRWLRLLMVSVYVFSAWSKFDATFLQTHGARFIETLWNMLGGRVDPGAQASLARWALLLPLGELLTAVLLAVRGLRRWGLVSATLLHLTLILLLGPWGLNHRWAVLIWNASFLAQAWLLFAPSAAAGSEGFESTCAWWPPRWMVRVGLAPVLLAILFPLTESWGMCDPWLAWGLYSTRSAKVEIFVARDSVAELPDGVQAFCHVGDATGPWVRLEMDRWSLEELQAPIYPHERFQLGVGLAVSRWLPPHSDRILAVRTARPGRRSAVAQREQWLGSDELWHHVTSYAWNAIPRLTTAGP